MELNKSSVTYAHAKLKIDDYWNRGITGQGIKIGIFDDGVGTHDALPISGGYACGEHTTYKNENSHATHCAGIALAKNLINGKPTGVAPDAELYSIRMYYKTYSDRVKSFIEAIDYAIKEEIDILSMSVHLAENSINMNDAKGSSLGVPKHLRLALKDAFFEAYKLGIIIVVAAGNHNDGSRKDNIEFEELLPKMPNVVTVANANEFNYLRASSGVGKWVDITGYGTSLTSTLPNNRYGSMTGTSMSTPQIAGIFALYKQMFFYNDLTNTEIIDLVLSNCERVEEVKDTEQGAGIPQPPKELYEMELLTTSENQFRLRNSNNWQAVDQAYYRDSSKWEKMEAKGNG